MHTQLEIVEQRISEAEARAAAAEERAAESAAIADARGRRLRDLAELVGAPTDAHDVTFRCADGTELGASRLLLSYASAYYRALFSRETAESRSGVVIADADFSSATHAALLRQLHSFGEAELPADAGAVLELLKLVAKLHPPVRDADGDEEGTADGGHFEALTLVLSRCEDALTAALDGDNCLDVLLHVKADASSARVAAAAEALIRAHANEMPAHPCWARFCEELPADAARLVDGTARSLPEAEHRGSGVGAASAKGGWFARATARVSGAARASRSE